MNHYFTTGEFAQLCGVSKHTLFHYDALGIFSPAITGENGYRYYSVAQLEVFHVIAALKELDMPLSEIKAYLDRRSPAELVALLDREEGLLTAKIGRLRQMRDMVRQKAALTRMALRQDGGALAVEDRSAALLVRTPALPMNDDRNVALSLAEHVRYCERHGVVSPYSVGSMLPLEAAGQKDFAAGYSHFYTQVDRKPRGVEVYVKEAGAYLTACHVGGYDTVGESYRRMLRHAETSGLGLLSPFFEDVLLDELSVEGYDNYVLQLSVRVVDNKL